MHDRLWITKATPGAGAGERLRGVTWLPIISATFAAAVLLSVVPMMLRVAAMPEWNGYAGTDYEIYMNATRRWIDTGLFYEPHQVTGPYDITLGDVLYPPVALWLFVPFTVIPGFVWWAIPIGVTAFVIWKLAPGPIAWPVMAFLVVWEPTMIHLVSGNPQLWVMMFVALGTLYRWPAVFALVKASLFPFALFGIWDRRWWYGLAVFCALSLPLLPMWFDWLAVVTNSRNDANLLYSWQAAPMLMLPLVAWAFRQGGWRA
jgi:hypothetical protein